MRAVYFALMFAGSAAAADRVPWTSGKVTGSPEPPPPYAARHVFPAAKFNHPLLIAPMPGSELIFVGEQDGKILTVDPKKPDAKPELFVDLKANWQKLTPNPAAKEFEFVYGLVFHPEYAKNRTCFVCYTLKGKKGPKVGPFDPEKNLPDGTRVSRFTVNAADGKAPTLDIGSEEVILTFPQGGHNGGDLHFGHDGYLYITTGDAADPNPPDPWKTGTDCSDLLGSVLRIDINAKDEGKNYAIPKDNPFVGLKHRGKEVRPEIWSYGFRNPWRMSIDRKTGDVWLGDVGWEQWEMVHKLSKGSNHGWSVAEARQPINSQLDPGPTPAITPPVVELDHSQAASVNGGYVYRGKKFPEWEGKYIFSDYMTKRFWAATVKGDRCTELVDLIDPQIRSACFGQDNHGELYFADYDTGLIYTFEKNTKPAYDPKAFPTKLSATGLYSNVKEHKLADGVYPFQVNVQAWADGATSERFVALPGKSAVQWHDERQKIGYVEWLPFSLVFPKDSVLGRTLTLELEPGKSKRIETQILHYDGAFWQAYTFAWNDDQTDAELVPADGTEKYFTVADKRVPGGKREQMWSFASRTQCLTCHTPWAEVTLAFNLDQLNKPVNGKNQLATMCELGMIERLDGKKKPKEPFTEANTAKLGKHTDPHDDKANLNDRARSYLHVNCSHCHRNGGGGSVPFELTKGSDLKQVLDVKPTRGDFGLKDARIVSKQHPYKSTLLFRMMKFGKDRMPHIGSEIPDVAGLQLMERWNRSLCDKPVDKDPRELESISEMLTEPEWAMFLAAVTGTEMLGLVKTERFINAAAKLPPGPVRDLFEGYFPPAKGERKLGPNPRPKAITSLTGDPEKGKAVFLLAANKCVDCHKHGSTGKEIGPDLTAIGKDRTKDELLESLLLPSRRVEAKYQSYILRAHDGRAVTGVLVKRDAKETVLRDATNKEHSFAAADIDTFTPARESLMPSGLLGDLTPQQAADLLEFLMRSKDNK
ncbi:MAG: PQQ-dependent sugar dehydrogenase [Fimbriiglobus sp.]|nr:PQQ-dependent sugar dehydrogenase [Fimbriiglobus sp.]